MDPLFSKTAQITFPSTEDLKAIVARIVAEGRHARLKFRGKPAKTQQVLLNAVLAYLGSLTPEGRLAILAAGLGQLDAMLADEVVSANQSDLSNPESHAHGTPGGENRRGA